MRTEILTAGDFNAPSCCPSLKPVAAEALQEFVGVVERGETVDVEPLFLVEHRMATQAQRQILAEVVNLVVAAALAQFRRQCDLIWPTAINGRWRQLALSRQREGRWTFRGPLFSRC